ncbi:MAG: DUF4317 domain-containing protein [Oscillospiraceae bacterium]|nr:DUF4317 domain-containing protein [Oscillospiraceae bacterium]
MIDKEISELRRRLRADRTAITHIYGCYVSCFGEILAEFDGSLALLPLQEQEKYLDLLRKGVSGSIGRTLSDLSFPTAEVLNGQRHALLMKLLKSRLEDAEARRSFYERVAGSLRLADSNYLILLAADVYDVPFRARDEALHADSGETQFSYLLCSICPVKETRPSLCYEAAEKSFRSHGADWAAGNPELGFLFPAFDDRAANLYGALLYNRSKEHSYDAFIDAIFHARPPMAVGVQKDTFREVLTEALDEECSPRLVQTVHSQLRELAAAHKEARDPEPLRVSCGELSRLLEHSGISEPRTAAFRVKYEAAFGADTALPPQNLLNTAQLEYKTPDVVIRVNPDRQDLVQVKEIGGVRCVVIAADEGIEINGVAVV